VTALVSSPDQRLHAVLKIDIKEARSMARSCARRFVPHCYLFSCIMYCLRLAREDTRGARWYLLSVICLHICRILKFIAELCKKTIRKPRGPARTQTRAIDFICEVKLPAYRQRIPRVLIRCPESIQGNDPKICRGVSLFLRSRGIFSVSSLTSWGPSQCPWASEKSP